MKTTKLFFLIVTTLLTMTACSSDDDETINVIYYSAEGNISSVSTSGDFSALFGISDYTTAIKEVLDGQSYTTSGNKDTEVISACDAIYTSHCSQHPTWIGEVRILKTTGLSDNSKKEVIKTYQYSK